VLLSMTAYGQKTYLDSLNKAFDNCVFLHDSLASELTFAKELMSMDRMIINESSEYIEILEKQIDELNKQKVALNAIIEKVNTNYSNLEKYAKKQAKKAKASNIMTGVFSFLGGAGVGAVVTAVYFLVR